MRNPFWTWPFFGLIPLIFLLQGCFLSTGKGDGSNTNSTFSGILRFTHPQSKARFDLDSSYPITWEASDAAGSGRLRLSLFRGNRNLGDLAASLAVDGSYSWNLVATRSLAE